MTQLQKHLESLNACSTATAWAGEKTSIETWNQCERPDWLLWWSGRTNVNSKQSITLVACQIARTGL